MIRYWMPNDCFPILRIGAPNIAKVNFMMFAGSAGAEINIIMYPFSRWAFFRKRANVHHFGAAPFGKRFKA
ncbi:MAG: hypothetical protein RL571_1098 [Pseudomonadota bacterium]|jgi:hypothetical protein